MKKVTLFRYHLLKMFRIPSYAMDSAVKEKIRPYLCKYCIDDLKSPECLVLLRILQALVNLTPFVEGSRRRCPIHLDENEQNALVRIFSYPCP
jgi:hypothetical protein